MSLVQGEAANAENMTSECDGNTKYINGSVPNSLLLLGVSENKISSGDIAAARRILQDVVTPSKRLGDAGDFAVSLFFVGDNWKSRPPSRAAAI